MDYYAAIIINGADVETWDQVICRFSEDNLQIHTITIIQLLYNPWCMMYELLHAPLVFPNKWRWRPDTEPAVLRKHELLYYPCTVTMFCDIFILMRELLHSPFMVADQWRGRSDTGPGHPSVLRKQLTNHTASCQTNYAGKNFLYNKIFSKQQSLSKVTYPSHNKTTSIISVSHDGHVILSPWDYLPNGS